MPSFVATLAGLLALLGLQLYLLGTTGSINLPYGSPLVRLRAAPDHAALALASRWRWCPARVILLIGPAHARRSAQAANLRRRRSAG